VKKTKATEDLERVQENGRGKLTPSNLPRLSGEELFQLAAQLEVHDGAGTEESSLDAVSHHYVE
jgi:hypothetical protein